MFMDKMRRGYSFVHILIMIIIAVIILIIGIFMAQKLLGVSTSGIESINATLNNTSKLIKIG